MQLYFIFGSSQKIDFSNFSLLKYFVGKTQGTPSLKTGVKCIQSLTDCESDQSDWQGF